MKIHLQYLYLSEIICLRIFFTPKQPHYIFLNNENNVFSCAAGKKFQNVAKEGLSLDDSETAKAAKKEQTERFEPLLKWLGEEALKEHILRAELSERLASSPCALITSRLVSS